MPSRGARGWLRPLLIVLLVAVINLPMVHSAWIGWRLDRSGVERTVEVVSTDVLGSGEDAGHFVSFRYPEDVDPEQRAWSARVEPAAHDAAQESGQIEVRHLPDDPAAYDVAGAAPNRGGLVITLLADAVLLVVLVMAWRLGGGRRRPSLRMVAIEDVTRCPPGASVERIEGLLYLVSGEVSGISDDEIVLDVGDRDVRVVLDGHANPVGYQQPAKVRGLMVE